MKSTTSNHFSQVPKAEIQRSSFDRSHGYKTTFDAGLLIPVYMDEALPGDTHSLNMSAFARLATPLKPVMDNMFLESFFFAVPIRLIWDNWQKFNGEQTDPGDSTSFLVPTITSAPGYGHGSLSDFLGIPTLVPGIEHSALWHRAYNLIWNEWFRDENLQDSVIVQTDDGPDPTTDAAVVLRRGKRHDYFTSCLPWPQKGTAVELPLGSTAPVVSDATAPTFSQGTDTKNLLMTNAFQTVQWDSNPTATGNALFSNSGLEVDLSTATAATINQIREAFQIQRLYERDARGGTRYTEIIRSHFGVTSPDARLQRPEYLGGGSSPVNLTAVPQTSESGTTDQGNLAAYGTVSASGHSFSKSFTEHCILLGMVCVRADLTYQQGLNRMFSRQTRWDYYWPALSHLGEQEVLNKEIYSDGSANDELTFGYQERYAEYRYKPSQITNQFRSVHPTSLDIWHLAQDFGALPTLNSTFIEETPPIDRIIAVPAEPHFLFDSYMQLTSARPMPTYSVPGMIDHF